MKKTEWQRASAWEYGHPKLGEFHNDLVERAEYYSEDSTLFMYVEFVDRRYWDIFTTVKDLMNE